MRFSNKIIFGLLLLLSISSCWQKEKENSVPKVEPPLLGFDASKYIGDTLTVKNGETFGMLVSRLGLNDEDSYKITQMCDSVFDVRKLRAGNELRVYYADEDSVRVLKYIVYVQDKVRSTVFQCSDSLAVWNADKPVTKERKITSVTISSSLWNDMTAAGGSTDLIMKLAGIYQWSINFFSLKEGDRFQMIYDQTVCEGEVISIDTLHFCLFTSAEGKQVPAVMFNTGEGGGSMYWGKDGASLKRMFLKAPLKYNRISSRFSYARKHPVTGIVRPHTGVDYAAPSGTPVQAIGEGTVIKCGWDAYGGGNRIRIRHFGGYESSYMHLSRFAKGIRTGVRVSQGQLIGYVGATGLATGPHLDFRIWVNGRAINPLTLDSPASHPLDNKYLAEFNKLYENYMSEINGN